MRRSTTQVWIDVVSALLLREVQTRFGKRRFGALWLVAEPLLGVLLIVLIVGSRHPLTGGVDTAGFVLAGMVGWSLIRGLFTQVQRAANANAGLFAYRQVRPMAAMLARTMLESCLLLGVYLLLVTGFWWFGLDVGHPRPLELLGCWLLLTSLGLGMGLLLAALQAVAPVAGPIVNVSLRPLFWVSGVFYSVWSLAPDLQRLLAWNPLVHAFDLLRWQQFGPGYPTSASWLYPAGWAVGLLVAGLLAYQLTWRRMVAS